MGIGLSLYTLYHGARVSAGVVVDAARGRLSRERVNERMRGFGRRVVEAARIQLEVSGRERVPVDGTYIYMSNHQSHIDIPVFCHTMPTDTVRMVAKSELFRVPIWGRAMRVAEMIEVDRSNRERAIASLEQAQARLADGVSVWIAPEGTRSRTGAIGPLKKGGFRMAVATGTPIVPVAIDGTRRVLPANGASMHKDVPVRVTYGAPIPTAGRSVGELMEAVIAFYAEHVAVEPAE